MATFTVTSGPSRQDLRENYDRKPTSAVILTVVFGALGLIMPAVSANATLIPVLPMRTRQRGGGISTSGLNLVESTVSGNFAEAQGGGVSALTGSIVNSTISRNRSATNGGGVSTSGTLSLLHVTMAFNGADEGGSSLHRFGLGSELSFQNTILASRSSPECAGLPPASRGNNIIDDTSCGPRRAGDRPGIDPRLVETLAGNGGPTLTLMLRAGSPAIDAAANVGVPRDQRGVRRPQGARPDIGAVERN